MHQLEGEKPESTEESSAKEEKEADPGLDLEQSTKTHVELPDFNKVLGKVNERIIDDDGQNDAGEEEELAGVTPYTLTIKILKTTM